MHRTLAAIATALLFVLTAGPLSAKTIKAGSLEITGAWTRATPAGAKVAGGFVTIKNTGKTADRLIGGSFAIGARRRQIFDTVLGVEPDPARARQALNLGLVDELAWVPDKRRKRPAADSE